MLGLCFSFDRDVKRRDYWAWVAGWFSVTHAWERNRPDDFGNYLSQFQPETIRDAHELPTQARLVVMTAPDADEVKGNVCLYDYVHPKNAIYYFGRDGGKMSHKELPEECDKVYVPVDSYDLYASHAASITFYDRRLKCR